MGERVLITGAAGGIGTMLRSRLAQDGRSLRLLDTAAIQDVEADEEPLRASVTDLDAMLRASADVDAIVHLAGIPQESSWPEIMNVNIAGTHNVYEAARQCGVKRVVFASSNHAVGFTPRMDLAPDYLFPAPDTNYGVSKAFGESLGSMYYSRYGIEGVAIRILSMFPQPLDTRMLATWLSPDDGGRLFEAALSCPGVEFKVVWGGSANTRSWFSQAEARSIGFVAKDNSEVYAREVIAKHGELDPNSYEYRYLGGRFLSADNDADKFA